MLCKGREAWLRGVRCLPRKDAEKRLGHMYLKTHYFFILRSRTETVSATGANGSADELVYGR